MYNKTQKTVAPLTTDAREFHESLLNEYIAQIKESGITNATTYFERVNAFKDGRIAEKDDVREFLADSDLPLESFHRVTPTVNQDVMIATLNPGMQNTIKPSTFSDGEYHRQYKAGTNIEKVAKTVATNLDGFLTHRNNRFSDLIECLRQELNVMSDEGTLDEYVSCSEEDLLDGFFGDVCYTWVYKLATPDIGRIESLGGPGMDFARTKFAEEIFDIVQPNILVSVGKEGWKAVYEYLDNPEEQIEAYSTKSPVTDSYHPKLEKGAYSGLYRVPSEDLWIITTWHASYWIKTARLQENLQRLNAHSNQGIIKG